MRKPHPLPATEIQYLPDLSNIPPRIYSGPGGYLPKGYLPLGAIPQTGIPQRIESVRERSTHRDLRQR